MSAYDPIIITDADDPRVSAFTQIRERDLITRDQTFIIEGKIALEVALRRGRFPLKSVFVSETRWPGVAALIDPIPSDLSIYIAPQSVFDQIAGFHVHRGVLACAAKTERHPPKALSGGRVLVGIGLSNHDNVGALFRNAAAFGVDAIWLDETCCDPLYRKAIRVSAGTSLWMPYTHAGSAFDILSVLKQLNYAVWGLTPRSDAASIWDAEWPERLAIIVGPEGPGLSDSILERVTPMQIPMAPGIDSLNVATAAAIALAQGWRNVRK